MSAAEHGFPPIRLLIVDDSSTVRAILRAMLSGMKEIAIVGEAVNGREAVALTQRLCPDVVLMDIRMPVMDGREATEEIMATCAVPIIVFSSMTYGEEVRTSIDMLATGALDVIAKPDLSDPCAVEECSRMLVRKILTASKVAVVRHLRGRMRKPYSSLDNQGVGPAIQYAAVGIGSSTGGPAALRELFSRLPATFPLPVLLVQHITQGFSRGFLEWLQQYTPLTVRLAEATDKATPGTVLIAPEGRQMEVFLGGAVRAISPKPRGVHLPSADVLLSSMAEAYGRKGIGVILTGMGAAGVEGLGEIRKAGGLTVAQNQESSAVFGMPGEAIRRGAAEFVMAPEAMADFLLSITDREYGFGEA
jgi:two-component system chemotaxis response regulator CheB